MGSVIRSICTVSRFVRSNATQGTEDIRLVLGIRCYEVMIVRRFLVSTLSLVVPAFPTVECRAAFTGPQGKDLPPGKIVCMSLLEGAVALQLRFSDEGKKAPMKLAVYWAICTRWKHLHLNHGGLDISSESSLYMSVSPA